jgi:DNA-binding IclR family transcriptional regulator
MSSMSLEQRSNNNRTAQALSRGLQRLHHPAVADGNVDVRKLARTLMLRTPALQRRLDTRRFVEQAAETWKCAVGRRAFMLLRAMGVLTLPSTNARGQALLPDMASTVLVKPNGPGRSQAKTLRRITDLSTMLADLVKTRASGVFRLAYPTAMANSFTPAPICAQVRQVMAPVSRRLGAPR